MRMRNAFQLPELDDLLKHRGARTDNVVVVSIIGKSSLDVDGLKMKSIGRLFPLEGRPPGKTFIKGCYDDQHEIVYLHLYSLFDTDVLLEMLEELNRDEACIEDFLETNDEIKMSFCRYCLLLFYISHIVILSHPGTSFDYSYIHYFKALELQSKKMFEEICESLKSLDMLSPEWVANGRPCTPRLIFYFERTHAFINGIKKLEHNLEDSIYHILKKTRLINTSGCTLFWIPLNEEFVYIDEKKPEDPVGEIIKGLMRDCQPGGATQLDMPFSTECHLEKDFYNFLLVHVERAKTQGFDDNVSSSRHYASLHFELPLLEHWIEATKCLYNLIITEEMTMHSIYTDTRFSEQRCLKVLPLAVARYQEGLPSHYPRNQHEARLANAMSLFRAQARGPSFRKYEMKLEMECCAHWSNGRQQCETASMTGKPCKLSKHAADQEHMSGFIYKSVCDCGRKIANRDDPYTAIQANYIFYQQIATECICSNLHQIKFPIFEPSITEFKAATLNESEDLTPVLSDRTVPCTPELKLEVEKSLVRQPSTTEYLPGMLTLSSPPGLLPVFSSWSLICLGLSSIYSHNAGISEVHHPGFMPLTNYLLPWDVTVGMKTKKAWPAIGWSGKCPYPMRVKKGKPITTVPQTVKVFIGLEYECLLGHRFMLSAPDKILKATPGSLVKDTGHKIAESDMPLYYQCACRQGKIAQLMRIHVVTPKAPVYCTLNPKIQPAAGAPIFICTNHGPINLTQSSYWVMRLPFVYVADTEHYQQNLTGKLLAGTFNVVEIE